jgi:ribonuclease Z
MFAMRFARPRRTRVGPLLRASAALASVAALLVLSACDRLESSLVDRAVRAVAAVDRSAWLDDGELHVVLCGTGSPLPSAERAGPCTAVIAGGHFLLVDLGPGSNGVLGLLRLPRERIDGLLLTHFHSDHIAELGEVGMLSWALGREAPLPVYGPPGVAVVVEGFEAAYQLDSGYRIAHHGADLLPRRLRQLVPRPVSIPAEGAERVVLDADGLRVTAFSVDHAPVAPAYGYRFDYRGRSVVVSGDTAKNANLIRQARGADLLIHEALAAHLIEVARDVNADLGRPRLARIMNDILSYHTTPVEAAEVASESGVRLLVLTHLVPPPDNRLVRRLFLRGVAEAWDGEVVVGEDGLHFRLPAGSNEIHREALE